MIVISDKLRKQFGAASNLLIVLKVHQAIKFLDPQSLNVHEITAKKYFDLENQIQIVPFHDYKTEFIVLDCEEDTYKRTHNTSMQTLSHKSVFVDIARTSDYEKF